MALKMKWKVIAGYGIGEPNQITFGEYKCSGVLGKWEIFVLSSYGETQFGLMCNLPWFKSRLFPTVNGAKSAAGRFLKDWLKGAGLIE